MMSEEAGATINPQNFLENSKLKNEHSTSQKSTLQNYNSGNLIGNLKDKIINSTSLLSSPSTLLSPPPVIDQQQKEQQQKSEQEQQKIMNNGNSINQHQKQLQNNIFQFDKSQRLHNTLSSLSSSSSSSSSSTKTATSSSMASKNEIKAHALQRDLNEMKNSMSEISDLALGKAAAAVTTTDKDIIGQQTMIEEQKKFFLNTSFEKLIENDNNCSGTNTSVTNTPEPLVTFPEDEYIDNETNNLIGNDGNCIPIRGIIEDHEIISIPQNQIIKNTPLSNWQQQYNNNNKKNNNNNNSNSSSSTMNFEEKSFRKESSKTQFMTSKEGFSSSSSSSSSSKRNSISESKAALTSTTGGLLTKSVNNNIKTIQNNSGYINSCAGDDIESANSIRNQFQMKEIRGGQLSSLTSSSTEGLQQLNQARSMTTTTSHQHLASSSSSSSLLSSSSLDHNIKTGSAGITTAATATSVVTAAAALTAASTGTLTPTIGVSNTIGSNKIKSNSFSMENHRTISQAHQKQTFTSSGIKHMSSSQSAQANFKITSSSAAGNMIMSSAHFTNQSINENHHHNNVIYNLSLDDLDKLCSNSSPKDIDNAIKKYSIQLDLFVKQLRKSDNHNSQHIKIPILNNINEIIQRAWTVPTFGHKLGYSLCNALRASGGLDLLMKNCVESDNDVKFSSAKLLEQCLTIENRSHVVDNGLEKVVNIACVCTKNSKTDHSRIGTGILEHLFKHSEGTCSDVIRLGGLDAVLFECRRNDTETLRHCAGALANLSLYGGADNQEAMINKKVPMWLFPLAFHDDDTVKYYACLAIVALVANKEIEAEVLKSGTLDLVEPFVTTHNPFEFAKSNLSYAHGQSKHWLQRLVPVLNSNREEARNLAAFHFCMEAGIKKEQGCTNIFNEIGAIEPLKTVASCPNAIASKFAAQALRLIGEQVPHKLSQQVPLWSVQDVQEWVKQIGFEEYSRNFSESLVDGDLLLQLNENNLKEDIGICNGIKRKRFLRELQNLMKMADYSSKDAAKIHNFLSVIGTEYCTYTYAMLNAGVDRETLKHLTDDQLIIECNITNSIHRLRILNLLKNQESNYVNASEESLEKTLDVFVSYRRSNGSQLASLLKVHLQLRGFSVFIDVERLEAGKFDNNLLNSIRQAKHFILVLTPEALERCIEDYECKDWVHREIVAALNSNCNIIPIIDNFQWPEPEQLPEDMRSVCHFNGVRWIHDYQDACVDKLERFMRGELTNRITTQTTQSSGGGGGGINNSSNNNNNINNNNNNNNNNNSNNNSNTSQYCGDISTPSTPGTASTTRSHPPSYQRMHSNDSGKLSDKDINGNNNNNNNNISNSSITSNNERSGSN